MTKVLRDSQRSGILVSLVVFVCGGGGMESGIMFGVGNGEIKKLLAPAINILSWLSRNLYLHIGQRS